MKLTELIQEWQKSAAEPLTKHAYSVRLPMVDAARVAALAELFPGRTETQIISELLAVALDEIEAAFPYIQGTKVVDEDECGDPIYEDVGLTPRFYDLKRKHLEKLEKDT